MSALAAGAIVPVAPAPLAVVVPAAKRARADDNAALEGRPARHKLAEKKHREASRGEACGYPPPPPRARVADRWRSRTGARVRRS